MDGISESVTRINAKVSCHSSKCIHSETGKGAKLRTISKKNKMDEPINVKEKVKVIETNMSIIVYVMHKSTVMRSLNAIA